MSTILDALKKVERERESPGDRLRHDPEPTPPRSRRVSTITIVVCAILGFGAGAGIALWRNAAPAPGENQGPLAVPAAPHIDVPASSEDVPDAEAPRRVARAESEVDEGSALEPSPFARPSAPKGELAEAAVPAHWGEPAEMVVRRGTLGEVTAPPAATGGDNVEPQNQIVAGVETRPEIRPPTIGSALGVSDDVPAVDGIAPTDEALDDSLEVEDAALDEDSPPAESDTTVIDTGRSPPGAPRVTLSFLQYSADPARRFAFLSVDGGPSQRVREGDAAGAASVDLITPDGVRLRHADTLFVIRPRH